ncbi:MAG: translation initiation factor IF-2 [Candidatus Kapaibacteriales bacterium]
MVEQKKKVRLHQVATELNIGKDAIVDFLNKTGFKIENKATSVVSEEMCEALLKGFVKEKKGIENLKRLFGKDSPQPRIEMPITEEPATQFATTVVIEEDLDSFFVEEVITTDTGEPKVSLPTQQIQVVDEKLAQIEQITTASVNTSEILKQTEPVFADQGPKVGDVIDLKTGKPKAKEKFQPSKPTEKPKIGKEAKKTKERKEISKEAHKEAKPSVSTKPPKEVPKPTLEIEPPVFAEPVIEEVTVEEVLVEDIETSKAKQTEDLIYEDEFTEEIVRDKWLRKRGKKPTPIKQTPQKRKKFNKTTFEIIQESDEEIEKAIKTTLHDIADESEVRRRAKIRHKRKEEKLEREQRQVEELVKSSKIFQITEFITTAELAKMLNVEPTEIITKCFQLGIIVAMNQRLDKDLITLVASDYGYEVEFIEEKDLKFQDLDFEDPPESLRPRPPIVTIMGHVDHGKTSLLDYIRKSNIVAGEAGGITQHIGAYQVEVPGKGFITFIDTPGHEAFTAMRARGAMVTDIVVLVVAADDAVMPQTIEAINHARAANVPMIIAINKIDKPDANPDRIRQQLSELGILVEDWLGSYQSVEISAKFGTNVGILLEKILLEAELLDLKANPNRPAKATIVESHLDKGRGPVATAIIQKGTLKLGDIFVSGLTFGRVQAMFDERDRRLETAPPSTPVRIIGFDSLPEAGDVLYVVDSIQVARQLASRRSQIKREQLLRQTQILTLDDLSKQIKLGSIKELNLILKADVTGSVEALSESLLKLSTDEVKVNILHKGVGSIVETDVSLAAASNAVIIAFQVSPTGAARKLAEKLSIEIRRYEIIYDCVNDVKLALEGLLSPDILEQKTATIEVRRIFKIAKLGTVAGCYVQSGKISRNDKIRVLRDGLEIFSGNIASLKRAKDDVREVDAGYECGIMIEKFNDVQEGDILEGFKIIEVRRTLDK